jgi:hypothetical protein
VLQEALETFTERVLASDLTRATEALGLRVPKRVVRERLTVDEDESHTIAIPGVIITEHPTDTFWYEKDRTNG